MNNISRCKIGTNSISRLDYFCILVNRIRRVLSVPGKEIHIYREKCLGSTRSALIYDRPHVGIISIMLIMRLSKLETCHTP